MSNNPTYIHGATALSDKASDTTSQSGASDLEIAAVKATAVNDQPDRSKKVLLCASVFGFLLVGATVATILATKNEVANTSVVDTPTSEGTAEPSPEAQVLDTRFGKWTTSADYANDESKTDVPLFSVGNFTGLGNVISFEKGQSNMGNFATKAIIGNPASGCVSVMTQVDGSDLDMMWSWESSDNPEPPVWEMVGNQVCTDGTLFGSQVSGASPYLGSIDTYPKDDALVEGWHLNKQNHFIASNPTRGTVSLYMYSQEKSKWVVAQEIPTPEGYEYTSFTSEDDTLAISYVPTSTVAMAKSSVRSPADARIDVYQVLFDAKSPNGPTTYTLVGEKANFAGVDVDTDSNGYVATLDQARMIRVYSPSETQYTQLGEAFEPARIFNDNTVVEEDLTVVKCDEVDVVLTAAVSDTGSNGKKTLGIGRYSYYSYTPDASCDLMCFCLGANLYPDSPENCDYFQTQQWLPAYHGAAEFEPNPTRAVDDPLINFNNKGSTAAVATKAGFMAVRHFEAQFPMDFDLHFDQATYVSHEVIGISGLGVVSVLVKSKDGSEEIQNWMMSGH